MNAIPASEFAGYVEERSGGQGAACFCRAWAGPADDRGSKRGAGAERGAEPAAQEPIAAVWKEQRLNFLYSSATTVYSCSALAGRVSSILRAVGARDDVKVTVNDCSNSGVPTDIGLNSDRGSVNASIDTSVNRSGAVSDRYYERRIDRLQTMHVYVRLMMPTEVTPDVLTELKKDKSRRELISHVTGNPAPRFNDPVLFSAQWQPVTLSSKTIGLEPEECELLDQMSSSVFRELGVRVVRKRYSCDPDRVSHIAPELVAEALLAYSVRDWQSWTGAADEKRRRCRPGCACGFR